MEGAAGTVKVQAGIEPAGGALRLGVELTMRDGWHVNARKPLQPELIPTELGVDEGRGSWRLGPVSYPEGKRVRLGFQDEPLLVYDGTTLLTADISGHGDPEGGSVIPVRLRIQACNDQICLRPEEIVLEVPAAAH